MDDKGMVLTRIWCLYEIWKTITIKKDASRLIILMQSLYDAELEEIFLKFHVDKAQATVQSDRESILKDIEQSIGTQKMTESVKKVLLESSCLEVATLEASTTVDIRVLVQSLFNCSCLHRIAGELSIAGEKAQQALELSKLLKDDAMMAASLNKFALVKVEQGTYAEAIALYTKALSYANNLPHEITTGYVGNLAHALEIKGKYSEAEILLLQVLAEERKLFGEKHPNVATSLHNIAHLYYCQGKLNEAEEYYNKTLELTKEVNGEEHSDYADSLNGLAMVLMELGKYSTAEEKCQQALQLGKKLLGNDHPNVLNSLSILGSVFNKQRKYSDAEMYQREVLHGRRKLLGEDHPDAIASKSDLATTLEKLCRKALTIQKQLFGKEHLDIANTLLNLGMILQAQGKSTESEKMYRDALVIGCL